MKVKIYLKGATDPKQAKIYQLEQEVFSRFSKDFERYLKEGAPHRGIYKHGTEEVKDGIREIKEILLKFDQISVIG